MMTAPRNSRFVHAPVTVRSITSREADHPLLEFLGGCGVWAGMLVWTIGCAIPVEMRWSRSAAARRRLDA